MSLGLESMRQVVLENADDPAMAMSRQAAVLTKIWYDMWGDELIPEIFVLRIRVQEKEPLIVLWWRSLDDNNPQDAIIIKDHLFISDRLPPERLDCLVAYTDDDQTVFFRPMASNILKKYEPGV